MVKCKDCFYVKKRYIPAWDEYRYRCGEVLTMQDMSPEEAEEEHDCELFKSVIQKVEFKDFKLQPITQVIGPNGKPV